MWQRNPHNKQICWQVFTGQGVRKAQKNLEVDITGNIQSAADQVDRLVVHYAIAERAWQLLAGAGQIPEHTEVIEREYSETLPRNTGTEKQQLQSNERNFQATFGWFFI